jgi:hypothetical protein
VSSTSIPVRVAGKEGAAARSVEGEGGFCTPVDEAGRLVRCGTTGWGEGGGDEEGWVDKSGRASFSSSGVGCDRPRTAASLFVTLDVEGLVEVRSDAFFPTSAMSGDAAVWGELDAGVRVAGGKSTGTGGREGLSFAGRLLVLWTRMKGDSGSLAGVTDAEEHVGGTFVSIGSGEGGGREDGVEDIMTQSVGQEGRKGEKSGQKREGQKDGSLKKAA